MSDSKCQTVFLAVHNTIWGWWYKTMANFHWIRSSPMDSQCKCHSGGTNIFRFYDKHKCIINLDLARNTELVPNIHMSYSEKRWKDSNQGWTGKLFFSRGGDGQGQKSMGRGTPPSPECGAGRGRGHNLRGWEGPGRGTYCVYWLKSYAAAKVISICIALSEVDLLNIHNLDRNHN